MIEKQHKYLQDTLHKLRRKIENKMKIANIEKVEKNAKENSTKLVEY